MTEHAEPAARARATLELTEVMFRGAAPSMASALSLHSEAQRIGLVGDWEPLFSALTEPADIESGSVQVLGRELHAALHEGVLGLAVCDPPLPGSFSVSEYLEHAARLSHGSSARAKDDARRTLSELGLAELSTRKVGTLAAYQRRALGIALATLTAPAVVCLETPLRGLDAASADYVARLCAHAARSSRLIVSSLVPSVPSPEHALLGECQDLFWLERGALLAHGSPETVFAPGPRCLLTILGAENLGLVTTLSAAGCRLSQRPGPSALLAGLAPGSAITRYFVELPKSGSGDLLLDAALATGVTVLELEPLSGLSRAS